MEIAITAAITSVISALVGAIVSGILTRARIASGKQQAMESGMRALLKAELFDLHYRYCVLGMDMDAQALELASSTYTIYHDLLGGNGLATRLFRDLEAKEISHTKEALHE